MVNNMINLFYEGKKFQLAAEEASVIGGREFIS